MGFPQEWQFGPVFNSLCLASCRGKRETTAGKASHLRENTTMDNLLQGRSGGPSLWGAYLRIAFVPSGGQMFFGRHGEAAIVAPDVVLVVVKRYRKRLNCLKSLPGYLTLVSDKTPPLPNAI